MSKNDFDIEDLENLDLVDRYDDPFSGYKSITWKSYALLYVVLGGVVGFIIWASFAKVNEFTRAAGRIIPSSEVQAIQNLEGGIVEEFLVKEGDDVAAGQIIARMSGITETGEFKASLKRLYGLEAQHERLTAEIEGRAPEFEQSLLKNAPDIVALERAAYQANTQQISNQKNILEQQLRQAEQSLKEIDQQIKGVQKIYEISQEELAVIKPLEERGTVSRFELLQVQSRAEAQKAELNNLKATREKAQAAIEEAQQRIEEQKARYVAMAQQQLVENRAEFVSVKETLASFEDRAKRRDIRSPVDGVVKDFKIATIGGVVRPGDVIAEIVPSNDQLIVQAMVSPTDIAFIYPEQEANVKLTAYDFTIYGDIKARVQDISADALETQDGTSFYRVRLYSDQTALEYKGEALPIIPGMVAQVEIQTGNKTIMDYLLKPFKKTLGNALSER